MTAVPTTDAETAPPASTTTLRPALRTAVERLAYAQNFRAALAEEIGILAHEFKATHAEKFAALETAKAEECTAEVDVAAVGLALFKTDPTKKKLGFGIGISERKKFTITDAAAALEFARSTKLGLVPESFDEDVLLKMASAKVDTEKGTTALPFVGVTVTPSVTITNDLVGALAKEPAP